MRLYAKFLFMFIFLMSVHCGIFGRTIQVTSHPPAMASYAKVDDRRNLESHEPVNETPAKMFFWFWSKKKIMLESPGFARTFLDPEQYKGQKAIDHRLQTNIVVMADTSLVPGRVEEHGARYIVQRRYRKQEVDRSRVATVLMGRNHPFFDNNEKIITGLSKQIGDLEEQIKKHNEQIASYEAEARRLAGIVKDRQAQIDQAGRDLEQQLDREKTLYPEQEFLKQEIKRQDEIIRLAQEKKMLAQQLIQASLQEQKQRGDRERAAIEKKRQAAMLELARARQQLQIELLRQAGPLRQLKTDVQTKTREQKRVEQERKGVMDNT